MKKTLIIFGNMTFDSVVNGTPCVTIHEIEETLLCPSDSAEEVADQLVNIYTAYVIPARYEGTIFWE